MLVSTLYCEEQMLLKAIRLLIKPNFSQFDEWNEPKKTVSIVRELTFN